MSFSNNYGACVGSVSTATSGVPSSVPVVLLPVPAPLWYPDWEGNDDGCVNDGNESAYMTDLNYLFATLSDCCAQHYNWDSSCAGAAATPGAHLYYPDWGGGDDGCKTGGGQPQYMNNSPSIWMHATLAECCNANYR